MAELHHCLIHLNVAIDRGILSLTMEWEPDSPLFPVLEDDGNLTLMETVTVLMRITRRAG